MSIFRVGQKVVCVDATTNNHSGTKPILIEGAIYTILANTPVRPSWPEDGPGVLLVEVRPSEPHPAFRHSRFRPLVEKKTDISIFKEILAGTRQPEGVEA